MENEGLKMPRVGLGKLRCDATWAGLTSDQRETLEGWLFEENLGYTEVLERAQKEFGIAGSKMSLVRFYQRVAAERAQREFLELDTAVKEMKGMDVNINEMKSAAMCLITKRLMKLSLESPDKVKEMAWLGQVLVASEAQEVKRGWLNIGREKFELDFAAECLARKAEKPPSGNEDGYAAEDEEVLKIRKHLFGGNLPQ
jgi:hypothetical protein